MAPTTRRPARRARPAPKATPAKAPPRKAAPKQAPPAKSAARKAAPPKAKPARKRPQPAPTPEAAPALSAGETVFEAEPVAAARPPRILPVEIEPQQVEAALAKLGGELKHWANKGRYTRVRFKFRGKQLLPDLPLAAVVAAEGLTFYWGGILRMLLVNVAGTSLLSVELVNDSEKKVQAGREALLSGDLDAALAHFRTALEMDRDSASAYLNLGVALKLKGDREGAREALQRARTLDAEGGVGAEAERLLATLSPPAQPGDFVPRPGV